MKWSYSNDRDGKDAPVTGNPAYDAVAVTQNSPTEGTIVYKKGGKAIVTVEDLGVKGRQDADGHHDGTRPDGSGDEQRRGLHQAVVRPGTLHRDSHG